VFCQGIPRIHAPRTVYSAPECWPTHSCSRLRAARTDADALIHPFIFE
jgi:hypothetical protein